METKNIDGVEYIPIDSIELDGSEDITERMTRAKEELQTKQAVENDRKLADQINKHYGKDLKDVGAFITLCKVKKLTADDDKAIQKLFSALPKSSRKNALSRFLKL